MDYKIGIYESAEAGQVCCPTEDKSNIHSHVESTRAKQEFYPAHDTGCFLDELMETKQYSPRKWARPGASGGSAMLPTPTHMAAAAWY